MKVAIIGGGPGGLFTAYLLSQKLANLDITILEAKTRLGGKIITGNLNGKPYEIGTAELYKLESSEKDPLFSLITEEFGFSPIWMQGSGVSIQETFYPDTEDLPNTARQQVEKLLQLGKSKRTPESFAYGGWEKDNQHPWSKISFEEILQDNLTSPLAKKYLKTAVASDLAIEPALTNGVYGFDNLLVDKKNYCQLYTIEGGIERLIQALASELKKKVRIVLEAPVRKISQGFKVIYGQEELEAEEEFQAIFICLPQAQLSSITFDETLSQAMTPHFVYYNYPAHYLRISLEFKKVFWDFDEDYFQIDSFGGCCIYNEFKRYEAPVLSFLIPGTNAQALSNCADSDLIEQALNALPLEWINSAKELLLKGKVARFVGSVNAQPGGLPILPIEHKHLPLGTNNFLVVGDYLFDSTLNGLLESADIATEFFSKGQIRRNPGRAPFAKVAKRLSKN